MAIYLTHAKDENSCPELHTFMITSLVINAVIIILALFTAYVSSLGTILNSTLRRRIPILIYFRCPLILFEFVWNIVGSLKKVSSNFAIAYVKFWYRLRLD